MFETFKPQILLRTRKVILFFSPISIRQLQLSVLDQVEKPKLVACDTMNLWIKLKPDVLKRVIKRVDFLFINDGEARQFANTPSSGGVRPYSSIVGAEIRRH